MKKKAFTLIELMVVIAIIGVLLAVIAPQVFRQINKGKTAACEQFYAAVKTGATSYYSDTMQWPPTTTTGGEFLSATTTGWDGPYLDRWQQLNPWGGTFGWVNTSGTVFNSGTAAAERYITISSVPYADAVRMDTHIDGSAGGTSGWVRHGIAVGGTGNVNILVARDGTVT